MSIFRVIFPNEYLLQISVTDSRYRYSARPNEPDFNYRYAEPCIPETSTGVSQVMDIL